MDERLERLRQKLAATDDPDLREALEDKIVALEKLAAAEPMQPPAGDTISVGDLTHVTGVAIGPGARAIVYIDGRPHKSDDQLLADYYQRLVRRCQSVPLQGVYEQRSTRDNLDMAIDRVYTQLATGTLAEREVLDGATLAVFDAADYLARHRGDELLPEQQRSSVRAQRRADRGASHPVYQDMEVDSPLLLPGPSFRNAGIPLVNLSASDLAHRARQSQRLVFYGPQLVGEAIAAAPRLVLLGEPGSGKSTALRYLANALAQAGLDPQLDLADRLTGWAHGRRLPIFMPLLPLAKRFAEHPERRGDADDLWSHLAHQLQPQGTNASLATAVLEQLEAGRVILLLDGLDEVAGGESRRKVVRAVGLFAERYPDCRIVVACRVRAYVGERNAKWQLPGWPEATLADWTIGQMQAFVRAWYGTVAELRGRGTEWRDDRVASLMRAIATREDLQRFGRQPLMLTVMALVHLNDGRLPEERASLYGRCIDILLGQWEVAGKDASEYGTLMEYIGLPDADAQSMRPLLGRAAYEAHRAASRGEVGRLSRAVLRTMVDDDLKRRRHPNPSWGADRFLEYTDQRAGLIQASDSAEDYSFPHQTFQEYLAGTELVAGVEPVARILELRNDDRWRRPILLGVEQVALISLDLPYRLLSRLVEAPGRAAPQRAFDLLLVQELAADLGWDWLVQRDPLFDGLKHRLAQALAEILAEVSVPARDRVAAGTALATLGDSRPGVCSLPPAMVELPAGMFMIGSTADEAEVAGIAWEQYYLDQGDKETAKRARNWPRNEINDQELSLSSFAIGQYLVTNAQFAQFMAADGYHPEKPWWDNAARIWLTRDDTATEGLKSYQRRQHRDQPEFWDAGDFGAGRPNFPVVGVNWYEAMAFCRWLTQHLNDGYLYGLPSEAEWEYTACGMQRRSYPWGDAEPDAERANYNRTYQGTTAVGSFPTCATPEGVLDLAGNVWELLRNEYRDYPYDPDDGRENAGDAAKKRIALRGGSWFSQSFKLRMSARFSFAPDYHDDDVGFRLVRHRKM
jgi:formylglycine-generating enzyme required for sulfatase activity